MNVTKENIIGRAELLITKGVLPADKQNIVVFTKLAFIVAIASIILFSLGLLTGMEIIHLLS